MTDIYISPRCTALEVKKSNFTAAADGDGELEFLTTAQLHFSRVFTSKAAELRASIAEKKAEVKGKKVCVCSRTTVSVENCSDTEALRTKSKGIFSRLQRDISPLRCASADSVRLLVRWRREKAESNPFASQSHPSRPAVVWWRNHDT